jgi:hypothetical protein
MENPEATRGFAFLGGELQFVEMLGLQGPYPNPPLIKGREIFIDAASRGPKAYGIREADLNKISFPFKRGRLG